MQLTYRLSLTAISLCILAVSARANEGGMEGGGGMGVRCGQNIRVLDLYEAEEVLRLPLPTRFSDVESYLSEYGMAIGSYRNDGPTNTSDPYLRNLLLKTIKDEIYPRFSDIATGTRLELTSDATLPVLLPGCEFIQVAVYSRDGKIYRDREYWDLLDAQNQAALILHEGVYSFDRASGAATSDQTRRVIGLAFAEQLPAPLLEPIWAAPRIIDCRNEDAKFGQEKFIIFAVEETRNGISGMAIYFQEFKSRLQMERVSTFIPNLEFFDFIMGRASAPHRSTAYGSLFGGEWNFEFQDDYQSDYGIKLRAWKSSEVAPSYSWARCILRR